MKCQEVQNRFIPFIDDQLSIRELEAFLKHMEECDNCREEYDVYYTMIMGMRYLESDSVKELQIDSVQKLKSAQDYLMKYRILYLEKIILFVMICLGILILL